MNEAGGRTAELLTLTIRRSKLLIAYLALGVLAAGLISPGDAVATAVDDLLLGAYALVIWRVTRGETTLAAAVRQEHPPRSRRDLLAIAAVYALAVGFTFWFWFGGGLALDRAVVARLRAVGLDATLAGRIGNATPTSIEFALLLVLVLAVIRFSLAAVGLRPRHLTLGVGLSAFGLGLGVLWLLVAHGGPLRHASPLLLPGVFLFQSLVNGIPEEFAFRGVILSRLERLVANPQHALVLSSVLFVSSHTASALAQGPNSAWPALALELIAGTQPTGIAWGYLCHRTRSIWPGAIWHTTGTVLGPIFF